MNIINTVINITKELDLRAWAIFFSALVALWGYASSLRPYIHVYLSLSRDSKADMMFNITNKGKVGAKKLKITSENGNVIPRFDAQSARDGKSVKSISGKNMDLKLPAFHKHEMIPPDFHYETWLGRQAGNANNDKFTKPFVLIVTYKSSLPIINLIPYVGRFKEKLTLNPRVFDDVLGSEKKEVIEIDISLTGSRITGEAIRKYPS